MKLWVDDNRPLPSFYDRNAWTVEEAIGILSQATIDGEPIEILSLDYDAHAFLNWTFFPVVEWMREYNVWPQIIRIHTYNWWEGRKRYEQFFACYAPEDCQVDLTNPWDYMDAVGQLKLSEAPEWVQKFAREVEVVSK